MYKKIEKCRICGNKNLLSVLNLGEQTLTGIFPKSTDEKLTSGPLEIVKCFHNYSVDEVCGLVQLNHTYDNNEMYGLNYGYRSGLNQSMINHLWGIVKKILQTVTIENGDLIIDIGSNDGTLLNFYPTDKELVLAGIDPTGIKFKKYYPPHVHLLPVFFSSQFMQETFPKKKAKIISSIAMFYDLEHPMEFVKQVYEVLDDEGIWVFEQSYLPLMLEANAYDTICHEHVEYYAMKQIKWMIDDAGFKIIDIELNDTNGGSFKITAAKKKSPLKSNEFEVEKLLNNEKKINLDTLTPLHQFANNVKKHKEELCKLINEINREGKKVFGYGASTKGNVILQYCGFSAKDIPFIAEVNEDKFGSFTPATHIPIISEKEAKAMKPDYFLALPWHFKTNILSREKEYLKSGGKFIFPLPKIEIIG